MIFHGIVKIFIFFKFIFLKLSNIAFFFQKIILFSTLLKNEKDFYMLSMTHESSSSVLVIALEFIQIIRVANLRSGASGDS